MRNLFLILVLANVLYFLWDKYGEKAADVGVAIVEENQLGPPLSVSRRNVSEPVVGIATAAPAELPAPAVIPSEELAEMPRLQLAAVVGRSCVTVSFRQRAEADTAHDAFRDQGMATGVRQAPGQVFIGHWVQIKDVPSRAAGNEMLQTLQDDGMFDVYLIEDAGTYKLSLGLFSDVERAERIELQARSLDLPADITPRMRDSMIYYVDIGLPPGRGAGAMIEQYGEERVLLRNAATCPVD